MCICSFSESFITKKGCRHPSSIKNICSGFLEFLVMKDRVCISIIVVFCLWLDLVGWIGVGNMCC